MSKEEIEEMQITYDEESGFVFPDLVFPLS